MMPDTNREARQQSNLAFLIEDHFLTPLRLAGDTLDQLEAPFTAMQAMADFRATASG